MSFYDQSQVKVCQVFFKDREPGRLQDTQLVAILGVLSKAGFRLHPPTSFGDLNTTKLVYLCELKDRTLGRENLETALRTAKEQAPSPHTVSVTYTLG
jgi:hypothetical protein